MTPSDVTTFLSPIGSFFSWAITELSAVLSTIVASPALLILVLAMPICAWCVHLLRLFIRAN